MRFDPQAGVTSLAEQESGRRRRGRLGQEAVISNIGTVMDLSTAGMRVRCRRLPRGEKFTVQIRGLGNEVKVQGRVAWQRRYGLFRREAGIAFIDVGPELARMITELGTVNRKRRTI